MLYENGGLADYSYDIEPDEWDWKEFEKINRKLQKDLNTKNLRHIELIKERWKKYRSGYLNFIDLNPFAPYKYLSKSRKRRLNQTPAVIRRSKLKSTDISRSGISLPHRGHSSDGRNGVFKDYQQRRNPSKAQSPFIQTPNEDMKITDIQI